jgi:hypothetical protein
MNRRSWLELIGKTVTTNFRFESESARMTTPKPTQWHKELADAIDEFTNDRLDALIVLLLLVENIAYVETISVPEASEKSVLRALKNQLETKYELQLDLDIDLLAA